LTASLYLCELSHSSKDERRQKKKIKKNQQIKY
jgi:hypothetical protein